MCLCDSPYMQLCNQEPGVECVGEGALWNKHHINVFREDRTMCCPVLLPAQQSENPVNISTAPQLTLQTWAGRRFSGEDVPAESKYQHLTHGLQRPLSSSGRYRTITVICFYFKLLIGSHLDLSSSVFPYFLFNCAPSLGSFVTFQANLVWEFLFNWARLFLVAVAIMSQL